MDPSPGPLNVQKPKPFLLITAIQVDGLSITAKKKPPKVFITIQGATVNRLQTRASPGQSPRRESNLSIEIRDLSTVISFLVYRRRWWFLKDRIGGVDCPFSHFATPGLTETTLPLTGTTSSLTVFYQTDINDAATHLMSRDLPLEGSMLLEQASSAAEVIDTLTTSVNNVIPLLEPVAKFESLFDTLSEIHPFAKAAWGLLAGVYKVMKSQQEKDSSVIDLYHTMHKTYLIASRDDILQKHKDFRDLFDVMIRQTVECSIFILGYGGESYIRRLGKMDILAKVSGFSQTFAELEQQFIQGVVRKIAVISLKMHESVKFQEFRAIVKDLNIVKLLGPLSFCSPGTRIETLNFVLNWIAKCNGETLWLKGLAGTGKSTLMGSIFTMTVDMGRQSRLAAFLRFHHSQFNDPSTVIPSLAFQLAAFDDRIGQEIANVLKSNPHSARHPNLADQFLRLIVQLLKRVTDLKKEGPIVVLVDGLDECSDNEKRGELLDVLAAGFGKELPFVRLVLASRPIRDIELTFTKAPHIRAYVLDTSSQEVNDDIRHYFKTELDRIETPGFHNLCCSLDAVAKLTSRASGLFIWASTVSRFIRGQPAKRLRRMLNTTVPNSALEALTTLYETALSSIATQSDGGDLRVDLCSILGAVLVEESIESCELLTIVDIDALLFDEPQAGDLIHMLGSVATLDTRNTITLIHKSFNDFLRDKERSREWHIDLEEHAKVIVGACLRHLNDFLDTKAPSSSYRGSKPHELDVPRVVVYAYSSWMRHLQNVLTYDEDLDDLVRRLFNKNFLKLMELWSWKRVNDWNYLLDWTNRVQCKPEDRTIRYHAFQFFERYKDDMAMDPYHVYATALTFCPKNNITRKMYEATAPNSLGRVTSCQVDCLASASLRVYDDVFYSNCAAISPDGQSIAAPDGSEILFSDVLSGAPQLRSLGRHGESISAVAFSPDGSKIASASRDGIRIWSATTAAQVLGPIGPIWKDNNTHFDISTQEECGVINVLVFSPNGSIIASGSSNKTACLLGVATGEPVVPTIRGHIKAIESIAFFPDGSKVATGAEDGMIYIWSTTTGARLLKICQNAIVTSISFSPDGCTIASGSCWSHGIKTWNATSGKLLLDSKSIIGDIDSTYCVAFSPDGSKILSVTNSVIRVCDAATFTPLIEPIPYMHHSNAVFSFDGQKIISYTGKQIGVWDFVRASSTAEHPPGEHIIQLRDPSGDSRKSNHGDEDSRLSPDKSKKIFRQNGYIFCHHDTNSPSADLHDVGHVWSCSSCRLLAAFPYYDGYGRGGRTFTISFHDSDTIKITRYQRWHYPLTVEFRWDSI